MQTVREICERVLEYSWERAIEILGENGGKMELDEFMNRLEEDTTKEIGVQRVKYATNRIINPAYDEMRKRRVVDVRCGSGAKGGESTIKLLKKEGPDYGEEENYEHYLQYVAANLAKADGKKE